MGADVHSWGEEEVAMTENGGKGDLDEGEVKKLIELMLDFYESFNDVMKTGNVANKMFAVRGLKAVQEKLHERLVDYRDLYDVDLEKFEQLVELSDEDYANKLGEIKQSILSIKKKSEPLVEELKEETGQKKKKKGLKRKMERHIRSKG